MVLKQNTPAEKLPRNLNQPLQCPQPIVCIAFYFSGPLPCRGVREKDRSDVFRHCMLNARDG